MVQLDAAYPALACLHGQRQGADAVLCQTWLFNGAGRCGGCGLSDAFRDDLRLSCDLHYYGGGAGGGGCSAALLHRWGALYRRANFPGYPAGAGTDGPVRWAAADLRAAGGPFLRVGTGAAGDAGFRLWPEEKALVEAAPLRRMRGRAGAGCPAFVARGQNEGRRDGGLPELAERQRPGGGLLWNQGPDGRRAGAGGLDAEGGQPAGPVVLSGQRADRRKLPPAGGRAGQPVEG